MNYFYSLLQEEESSEDLYHRFMQDRTAQIGLSFYLYRYLLETQPKDS